MFSCVTNGVKVSVMTGYDEKNSKLGHFIFGYKIIIENQSSHTIQLLRRHWYIHDVETTPKEVEGEGVIGKQPILEKGQSHQYVSGCVIMGGIGKMWGYYTMERMVDGKKFDVKIPEFLMLVPVLLN